MPSIVTHYLLATEVKEKLAQKNININNEDIFYIFAQSFDNLFYYKFFTPWWGKKIRTLGIEAQKKNTNLYFKNIIEYIDNNKNSINEIKAYLYGSICHYILDSICHPFIFYYTGDSKIDKKYRGLHEKMEVNLDAYMLLHVKGKELKQELLSDVLLPKINFSNDLKAALNFTFVNTFQVQNMGIIYEDSIKTGHFLLKYFVTDRNGFKKELYKLKDFFTFQSSRKYQFLSFHVSKIESQYLNETKEVWNNPTDQNLNSNESFLELYRKAISKTVDIIEKAEQYWNHSISKETLLEAIGNDSYVTGLDCSLKKEMKYFKD